MKTVNPFLLSTLLDPLTGLADDDEEWERYKTFDSNNVKELIRVIQELIVPYSRTISEKKCIKVKLSYRYYLTTNACNFERVFDSILPPFNPPDDIRSFFLLMWKECFPGESYILENPEDYIVDPKIEETQEL